MFKIYQREVTMDSLIWSLVLEENSGFTILKIRKKPLLIGNKIHFKIPPQLCTSSTSNCSSVSERQIYDITLGRGRPPKIFFVIPPLATPRSWKQQQRRLPKAPQMLPAWYSDSHGTINMCRTTAWIKCHNKYRVVSCLLKEIFYIA